jgi:hypothetical protein
MVKVLIIMEDDSASHLICLALMHAHFTMDVEFHICADEWQRLKAVHNFCKTLTSGRKIHLVTWKGLCLGWGTVDDPDIIVYCVSIDLCQNVVDILNQYKSRIRCLFLWDKWMAEDLDVDDHLFSIDIRCESYRNTNTFLRLKTCIQNYPSNSMRYICDHDDFDIKTSFCGDVVILVCASFDTLQGYGIYPLDRNYFYVLAEEVEIIPPNGLLAFFRAGKKCVVYTKLLWKAVENVMIRSLCKPECHNDE